MKSKILSLITLASLTIGIALFQNCADVDLVATDDEITKSCFDHQSYLPAYVEQVVDSANSNQLTFAVFEEHAHSSHVRRSSALYTWLVRNIQTGQEQIYQNQSELYLSKPNAQTCSKIYVEAEANICGETIKIPGETYESEGCNQDPPAPTPTPPPDSIPDGHAGYNCEQDGISPQGYVIHQMEFEEVFYGNSYPNSGAPLAPVGSFTFRSPQNPGGLPIAGKVISIPIIPEQNKTYIMTWLEAVPIPELNYHFDGRVAAKVHVNVSPCPGDMRPPVGHYGYESPDDQFLLRRCNKVGAHGALFYKGTDIQPPAHFTNMCPLEHGKRYYINIAFGDAENSASNHCGGGIGQTHCEVNIRHQHQSTLD